MPADQAVGGAAGHIRARVIDSRDVAFQHAKHGVVHGVFAILVPPPAPFADHLRVMGEPVFPGLGRVGHEEALGQITKSY
ncbi:hypothetical protein D3C78_1877880 [compost metagenome]